MNLVTVPTWAILTYLSVAALSFWGYILNLIALGSADAFTVMVALRIAGIFVAPVGVILGWFF
jgi:hypothetical protein